MDEKNGKNGLQEILALQPSQEAVIFRTVVADGPTIAHSLVPNNAIVFENSLNGQGCRDANAQAGLFPRIDFLQFHQWP
jgi:hypothetical protein